MLSSAGRGHVNTGEGTASPGSASGAWRIDTPAVRDRAGEPKCSFGSSGTVVHLRAAFVFAGSASRCTTRFVDFLLCAGGGKEQQLTLVRRQKHQAA